MLNVEHTTRAYAGKQGCMCGCLGTYNASTRARKTAITQITKHPEAQLLSWNTHADGVAGCITLERNGRNRTLYLTEAGVEAVRAMGIAEAVV